MNEVITLAKDLLQRKSITPEDAGCQEMMQSYLGELGFTNESMVFHDTTNLWSRKGTEAPVFCFAGHTDVVPTGPESKWKFDPFTPTEYNGHIYARGAADMKSSLAAMMAATKRFVGDYPNHNGSIAFLITSDEEGPFINGTTKVVDTLEARNEKIDYCIVGEPTSNEHTGDVIKNGRRGSLTGYLTVNGKQGHVAYPHLASNPIHSAAPILHELTTTKWDNGNEFFPATSLQISNINGGTGAGNVIPGTVNFQFNFRYSTEVTAEQLVERVTEIINKHHNVYELDWVYNGLPFLTPRGTLVDACVGSIKQICGIDTELSTSGGTSDGRFIAPTGAQVVELGPENKTIHQVNECVNIDNVITLEKLYYQILVKTLA